MKDKAEIAGATTNAAAAMLAGAALAFDPVVQKLDGSNRPFLLLPKELSVHDLEQWLPAPTRLAQGVTLLHPDALCRYVNLFGDKARTIVFADKTTHSFRAIIDYHEGADKPSWNRHIATCTLKQTAAWQEWTASDRKDMEQVPFSRFLEEHTPDIAKPDAGVLIDIARKFDAVKIVAFKSHHRAQDNTVQFIFDEQLKDNTREGKLNIPEEFELSLSPYEGTGKRRIVARLRYQMSAQSLKLRYELVRAQDELELAFAEMYEYIGGHTAEHCRAVLFGNVTA